MNTDNVDAYLRDGCGRCERYRTPSCKVHTWAETLRALRELLSQTELVEELKWGAPCYTLDGANVVLLSALNDWTALSFPKGVALPDPAGLLQAPGPNTRIGRVIKFGSVDEVAQHRDAILALITAAIALERSGAKVQPPPADDPIPDELADRLSADPALAAAFEALTPGRKRSHILYIAGSSRSATRARRVEKCIEKIVAGRGFHER